MESGKIEAQVGIQQFHPTPVVAPSSTSHEMLLPSFIGADLVNDISKSHRCTSSLLMES